MKNALIFVLLAFLTSSSIIAQTGTIRGNVYDKETGEPIIYGTVQLAGTTIGTNTDIDGFFTLPSVPIGEYRLLANYVGYDSISVDIKIVNGQILYQNLYLLPGVTLGVVDVSARKEKARSDVQISKITVTPKQIRSLPSTGGEADIAQYLPVLPGIVFTGDQGGQLYIRGGSPVQNKILLDGATIINPFHSIGFFSVFETETLRSVDVLTGGFGAEYGGRISAVVDIRTREGNKKRLGGIVSANPFQGKVLLEGPIKKLKEEGGGSTSFLFTGKHSYLNETSKTLYEYASADSTGLPYQYTDLYGKLSFVGGNGSKLNLFGFNFTDKVNFVGVADLDWKSTGAGANFTLIPPSSSLIIGGTFAFSNYEVNLLEDEDAPRSSKISSFTAGLDFTYFGKNNEIKYGFSFEGFNTDFTFQNFRGITFQQENFTTELSAFFKYKHKIGPLVIEPSLRLHYYASLNDFVVEPRFGLKYNITDFLRFKFAGGLYSQNLISSVNEQDIVNLFVGFLSGPEERVLKPGSTEPTDHRLQKSIHGIAGFEIDLHKNVELNVEPYYKRFTQLININRNKLEATDANFASETGDAYGIDFSLKYEFDRLYLWATYSLGYVKRDDGEQEYPTIYDRRHNINLLGTYNLGPQKEWEVSARWNMGSGFPFTLTQGFYSNYTFEEGVNTNVLEENADLGIIFSEERNSGRLPYYHRLDFSLKRKFTFSKYMNLEVIASVTNVYDRRNIFFFDRVEYDRVDQLPILPSLGFVFKF